MNKTVSVSRNWGTAHPRCLEVVILGALGLAYDYISKATDVISSLKRLDECVGTTSGRKAHLLIYNAACHSVVQNIRFCVTFMSYPCLNALYVHCSRWISKLL